MALPSAPKQPGAWLRDRGCRRRRRMKPTAPSSEPSAGRRRVDADPACQLASALHEMTPRIQQHVCNRIPDFARRAQHMEVESIRENAATKPEYPVHGPCEASRDRLHPACQRMLPCGLDHEVHVIRLDRIVRDAKGSALARHGKARFELLHQPVGAQRGNARPHLERHMTWEPRRQTRTRPMRVPRIRTRLAPGSFATSTPARRFSQFQIELPPSPLHRQRE